MRKGSAFLSSRETGEAIQSIHRAKGRAVALVPVGCIEQHGPYLPLETDSLIAEYGSLRLEQALNSRKLRTHVYPAVHYSPTRTNMGFSGTASVKEDVFRNYCHSIGESILASPFDALIFVCSHAPAEPSLREIGVRIVNGQYMHKKNVVKPVFTVTLYGCVQEVESHFGQKVGRHADWRELLMAYPFLGEHFFSPKRIRKLREFRRKNRFPVQSSAISGVPMKYRSVDGVIGDPLPKTDLPLAQLSEELWNIHLTSLVSQITGELDSFFT
ncbi:MAG: creatininase family protein [Chitinispirillaceae bacterium]|jgi:creatinine amidohydrolase/Fe(II)-dependent formamide hydrolase-like protein|nr:creatininase family protein [Chitinispirillaceae bacterium]